MAVVPNGYLDSRGRILYTLNVFLSVLILCFSHILTRMTDVDCFFASLQGHFGSYTVYMFACNDWVLVAYILYVHPIAEHLGSCPSPSLVDPQGRPLNYIMSGKKRNIY